MFQITADLAKLYTSFMEQKGVETDQRQNKESLSAFLEKLKEKKQAHHAVSLFYDMGHLSGRFKKILASGSLFPKSLQPLAYPT